MSVQGDGTSWLLTAPLPRPTLSSPPFRFGCPGQEASGSLPSSVFEIRPSTAVCLDNRSTTLLSPLSPLKVCILLSGLPSLLGGWEVKYAVNHSCLILSPGPNGSQPCRLGSRKFWCLSSPARFKLQGQLSGNCWFLRTPWASTWWMAVYERFGHWVRFSSGLSTRDSLFYDCVYLFFLHRYMGSESATLQKRLLACHWPWVWAAMSLGSHCVCDLLK